MPQVSQKNLANSPAATALGVGLGDQLVAQAQDAEEENRRAALTTDMGMGLSASANTLLGPLATR